MILVLLLLLYEVWYDSITIPKRKFQFHSIGVDNYNLYHFKSITLLNSTILVSHDLSMLLKPLAMLT